ncbi:MAG TPA: OpgC domain-containing protein [Stellaceae bacterium]|jgi:hypothetical protein|nr:OpgC domain-containing protein [Stellaceae bacterium]
MAVKTTSSPRDLRLDFFRGLALFFIFIDHIPENSLSYFTLPSIGFSDAAEVFIFISGYTAAMVYGTSMQRSGVVFAGAQIYRRVWQLYVAHIFLFMIFTAEVSYTVLTFNNPMYNDELRVGDFLAEPHIAIIKALLLQFQPTFLDILPVYIVLLACFPLVLWLLRLHLAAALLPALALYAATQSLGLAFHGYPADQVWFFNPLAWQLLFVVGAACGYTGITGRPLTAFRKWLLGPAVVFVIASAVIKLSWTIHGVYDPFPTLLLKPLWPINKTNLVPIRLVHFLAVSIVVVHLVSTDSRFLRWRSARPIIICGQQSLPIFCLGILLSVLGHFVLTEWSGRLPMQIAVNFVGFALMIGMAALVTWFRATERGQAGAVRSPAPPVRSLGSS